MKEKFSSISERDISGFSDKDLEREIERRNKLQFYLGMISFLLFLSLKIPLACKIYKEGNFLFLILLLVIRGIEILIDKILANIKPLRTEHLERQLEKRRKRRQKERETEKVLYYMANGGLTVEATQLLKQEVFETSLEKGVIKITQTTEGNVKISIPASIKATKLFEISNDKVLKYFRMQEND